MSMGYAFPPFRGINKFLCLTSLGVFIVDTLMKLAKGHGLMTWVGLSGRMFFQGHVYQILTYPFVFSGPLELLFTGLLLWFLGSELESLWGPKRYGLYLAVTSIGAGLIYLLLGLVIISAHALPLSGMTGVSNALLLAYALLFPNRPLSFFAIFPLPAKVFCWVIIALQLYTGLLTPMGHMAWGYLSAMGLGYIYLFVAARLKAKKSSPKSALSSRPRHHLKLVDQEEDESGPSKGPKLWH